jgi:hypothetical protein
MSPSRREPPKPNTENMRRRKMIDEAIARAMAPYIGVLPEAALATMREVLEESLATHPVAEAALDALEAQPEVGSSGTRVRGDKDDGEEGEGSGQAGVA